MAITTQKGLKFPKVNFQKKANGQTSFYSATETFTLPASANWDSSTLFAVQLDHLPALAREAIGQTIADPVLTCTTDSTTRTINYKRPDSGSPATGEVYLDIYNGVIQFNSADASKAFSITYYVKGDLVDHNAMNRIWSAGASYIVGSQSYCDYPTLAALISAGVLVDYDSVKLMEDQTTTGLTITTKLKIVGNNRKIIKSGTATDSRAINFNQDLICEDVDFSGWSATGDICLYASADVKAIITKNKNIGGTQLTNASLTCSYCIVENNLPFSENIGQATTIVTNNVVDKIIKTYIANGSISVNDPLFLDLSDPTKCKTLSTVTDADIFLGFALNNASSGVTVNVCIEGVMSGLSGLTANKSYYINKTGGLEVLTSPNQAITDANFKPTGFYTGTNYPYFVGVALSSSTIMLKIKKKNNIVRVNTLTLASITTLTRGAAATVVNLFVETGTNNASEFNTSGHGWKIKIPMRFEFIGIAGSSVLPDLTVSFQEEYSTGSYDQIGRKQIQPMTPGSTYNGMVFVDLEFEVNNPIGKKYKLEFQLNDGTGTPAGSMKMNLVDPVVLTFL